VQSGENSLAAAVSILFVFFCNKLGDHYFTVIVATLATDT